jgi:hypothetical protein
MKKLALVIAAFLLLVAAAYYLFLRAPDEYSGPVPELVALSPREAEWIVFADLAIWRESPMLEHLRKLAPSTEESAEYRDFVNATGFDYSRDLDQVVVALIPELERSSRQQNYQPLAIADGRFSRKRITDHILKNGSRETHDGQEIFVVRDARSPTRGRDGETLLAFLSSRRVALADGGVSNAQQFARAQQLLLATAQPLPQNASLSPLAERAARVSGAPFFAVGRSEALRGLDADLKRSGPMAAQAAQVLSTVKWLTIAARPEQTHLRISILGECESAWQATQLGLVLDGLLVLARSAMQDPNTRNRLSSHELEQLEAILGTIQVERRSNVVELRMEVSADAIALAASASQ